VLLNNRLKETKKKEKKIPCFAFAACNETAQQQKQNDAKEQKKNQSNKS